MRAPTVSMRSAMRAASLVAVALALVAVCLVVPRALAPARVPVVFATLPMAVEDYAWSSASTIMAAGTTLDGFGVVLVSSAETAVTRTIWKGPQADRVSCIEVHAGGSEVTWSAGGYWYAWQSRTGAVARWRPPKPLQRARWLGPGTYLLALDGDAGDSLLYEVGPGLRKQMPVGRLPALTEVVGRLPDGRIIGVGEGSSKGGTTTALIEMLGDGRGARTTKHGLPISSTPFVRGAVLTPDGSGIVWLTVDAGGLAAYWLCSLHLASDRPAADVWVSDTQGRHLRLCASIDGSAGGFMFSSDRIEAPWALRLRPGGRQASYLFKRQVFVVDIQ